MAESLIWVNNLLSLEAQERLVAAVGLERLILGEVVPDWPEPKPDPLSVGANIIFGQPHPNDIINAKSVTWVHISTAGFDRYDNDNVRQALARVGAPMTSSSNVYFDSCAQHVVAFLLADCRQLFYTRDQQRTGKDCDQVEARRRSRMLNDQEVLIIGYGNIGRRVAELLTPFGPRITGYRRNPTEDSFCRVVHEDRLHLALAKADHIINILPDTPATRNFFDGELFRKMKDGARYYSVGRGVTTDHDALTEALHSGQIAAAYLDVTDPEPLPADHGLRAEPNCFVTPHCGSGHDTEGIRLVEHFLENLNRFEAGKPLLNQIM